MSEHVGEKCGKLYIFSIQVYKEAQLHKNLKQSDDTWTWSVVH